MDETDKFALYVKQYIDDHESLRSHDAFGDDIMGRLLSIVWGIIQTRPATQSDEAVADIRSIILDHIRAEANSLAEKTLEREAAHGTKHPSHIRQWWERE